MDVKRWNYLFFSITTIIILIGCNDIEYNLSTNKVTKNPENNIFTDSTISNANTPSPSVIPTDTASPSKIFTPSEILHPGEYIAVSEGNTIILIAITGDEEEVLFEGAYEGRNWISPNQNIVAYSENPHIITFRYIYSGREMTISEQESCQFTVTSLSWGPNSDRIVVACNYENNKNDLKILSFPEGEIIGKIEIIVDKNINADNYHHHPLWSPDGRWITFFISTGNPIGGYFGPLITDTNCLADENTCPSKTFTIVENYDALLAWTPDSDLAILNGYDSSIKIYNVSSRTLLNEINIPKVFGGPHSFAWSQKDDRFAFGTLNGIFIMSSETGKIKKISQKLAQVLFWVNVVLPQ
jgi:WD40 repeat protein